MKRMLMMITAAMVVGVMGCATADHGAGRAIIQRSEGKLVGTAEGEPLQLEIDEGRVTGAFRGRPVALTVEPTPEGTAVKGDFGGARADYVFTPQRVEGALGGCGFDFSRDGDDQMAGVNRCAGGRSLLQAVDVPSSVWTRSQAEQAAWVGLILAQSAPTDFRSLAGAQVLVSVQNDRRRR